MQRKLYTQFTRQIMLSLFILLVLPLSLIGHFLYTNTMGDIQTIAKERATNINYSAEKLFAIKGSQLLDLAITNSHWEDNRTAVEARNIHWIQENVEVAVDVLETVDFVSTMDLQGDVISQAGNVREFMDRLTSPEIYELFQQKKEFSGLIQTSEGLAIIAVSKVTDDLGGKPPAGMLIFGRILNNSDFMDIKETLQADVSILTEQGIYISTMQSKPENKQILGGYLNDAVTGKLPDTVQFFDKEQMDQSKVISVLKDVAGKPIGVFSTDYVFLTNHQVAKNLQRTTILSAAIIIVLLLVVAYLIQRQQYRLYVISITDELTGLLNRRQILESKSPFKSFDGIQSGFLLFMDLDRFKIINDTMGHDYGDLLLKKVAVILRAADKKNCFIYRIGGDEFIVVSPSGGQEDAVSLARRITYAFSTPLQLCDQDVYITCSIGISLFPEHGDNLENLMRNADIALSKAKQYRNRFELYAPGMNEQSSERVGLETELRKALDRNEMYLHYQPRWDLESGGITGVEALLRWNHPNYGIVPPDKFIPIAEETGMISDIGEWVLRTACLQMKQWQDNGFPVSHVAVNVSPAQFHDGKFVEMVSSIVKETGVKPEWMELELTESMLMKHEDMTIEILKSLNKIGLQLYIDDFGKGYSSLSYLAKFPINGLKIDRSFVHDIHEDENGTAVTTAIIKLGHSLRLRVIAEGVETQEQLLFLQTQHCNEAQGYLFSRPVPAATIESMLQGAKMAAASLEV